MEKGLDFKFEVQECYADTWPWWTMSSCRPIWRNEATLLLVFHILNVKARTANILLDCPRICKFLEAIQDPSRAGEDSNLGKYWHLLYEQVNEQKSSSHSLDPRVLVQEDPGVRNKRNHEQEKFKPSSAWVKAFLWTFSSRRIHS